MDDDVITPTHRQLIVRDLREVQKVADYLYANKILNDQHIQELLQVKTQPEKAAYLCSHLNRRNGPAFAKFIDALVSTRQLDLARALEPTLGVPERLKALDVDPSSGDGNCLGTRSRNSSGSQSNEPSLLEPSANAIEQNERFYQTERKVYHEVPQTDGLLIDLRVTLCKDLPDAYKRGECYQHLSKPKGLAIIFNNRKFNRQRLGVLGVSCLPERLGTDVDCRNVEKLLVQLGYDVKVKTDLTSKEMMDAMSRFAFKSEHDRCDSAVVVVLTHGTHGQLYGCDGELIKIETFISLLNARHCPALKNKPKLFIIQACRGDEYDEGVDGKASGWTGDGTDGHAQLGRIVKLRQLCDKDEVDAIIAKTATDADFLIAYATTPGYVSWRNTLRGSWFIQAICKIFAADAHREEILHLFTKVNRVVADQLSGTGHKQVPEPASRLTKKFYLLPGL